MASERNPRKIRVGKRVPMWRSGRYWAFLLGLFALAGLAVIFIMGRPVLAPEHGALQGHTAATSISPAPTASPVAKKKVILDFHMQNLSQGWIRYADSAKITKDGGVSWTEATVDQLAPDSAGDETLQALLGTLPKPLTVNFKSKTLDVMKSQFLTDRVGWVLAAEGLDPTLLVTVDGGGTWTDQVTPDVTSVMNAEQKRIQTLLQEAAYYTAKEAAKAAIQSDWTLFPKSASPGDVVLVRHKEAGEISWQGKKYPLQSFGTGYFAYLPLSIDLKPGPYPVGDQILTVKAKKFDTQYLEVTKQMESMRQDTARIQADQKKIDMARSRSAPEFLFSSDFIQPVEGILTTPYGYTRYVNGKYDSSHRAIDLAAKEGTPIKATNDGIVALADSLYLTGNSIYLDHGMGLFSQYAHMSELRVKTGDKVKKGDIIGLVGTTGFSTGPHLHFTFWANNVPVNPNMFFDSTPFKWLQP
ncbi:M23 family metallopeptidase [Paenibacillus sp. GP183]|uniref:M23 family metallopeptidase n=1 Tax=Paenibacillus sp. GP183 TaxID=1882751 RepID=UPI00089D5D51|nr:M23 family metallopeptidase [Paenibacillus sp. GP183]SEC26656.1 Peptidase family M23 [Paenibacillus sp. GP183]